MYGFYLATFNSCSQVFAVYTFLFLFYPSSFFHKCVSRIPLYAGAFFQIVFFLLRKPSDSLTSKKRCFIFGVSIWTILTNVFVDWIIFCDSSALKQYIQSAKTFVEIVQITSPKINHLFLGVKELEGFQSEKKTIWKKAPECKGIREMRVCENELGKNKIFEFRWKIKSCPEWTG